MKTRYLLTTSLIAASLISLQPAAAKSAGASRSSDSHAIAATAQTAAELPPITGPKRTIAVGKIDVIPTMAGPYSAAATAPGVAAMLATALDESGRFIVAERDDLGQVLNEQQLVTNGLAQGSAAPVAGNVIPAQFLLVGAVTELNDGDKGSNVSIGIGGLPSGLFGGLSLNGQKGRVAMDLRLVNTRTGQVEDSFKVKKEISTTGIGLNGGYKSITLGGNQFWTTPLGDAMRAALNEVVARIATDTAKGGWDALVAQASGDTIYINAGSDAGLKVGDHLGVEHVLGALTDPATNRVLTVQKVRLGDIELTAVEGNFATGTFVQTGPALPQRGATVVLAQ